MLSIILASSIILTPTEYYLGKLYFEKSLCEFQYGPGTVLAPETTINPDPPTEIYGPGSVINRSDGMKCGDCYIESLIHTGDQIIIYCDVRK